MRSHNRWTGIVVGVVLGLLFSAAVVLAGSLEPVGGPTAAGSQMYTLEQIYNRLNTGGAATKMTTFTEPSSGPVSTGYTLDEIMERLPALDDTNGADPADVAVGKTYWGLTSGQWGLKTGTMFPAPVPKTGQSVFAPLVLPPEGSDGRLFRGVLWPNPRFTDNNNGTVTDNLTGLIWLKNANCLDIVGGINKGSGTLTWADALTWSNNLAAGRCGLTDASTAGQWRLPNVREMQSLIHYGFFNPAVPNTQGAGQWTNGNPFTGVLSNFYWSSTTDAANTTVYAWTVFLGVGSVGVGSKTNTNTFYVWPVSGGQ